jgi:alanyl aminopeptidase
MSRIAIALVLAVMAGCPQKQMSAPAPVVAAKPAPVPVPADGLAPPQPTLRLPRNFVPTSYAARLEIDPSKDRFAGSIAISGVIDQRSAVIWLHGHHLQIQRASATKETQEIALTVTPRGEELLEVRAARPLEPGEWTLLLDYAGEIDLRSTTGAFKQTVGGASYVYSQLEALYARRVFPCFDEPGVKVPWKLTLDVPSKLVAVSNSPIANETPLADDRKRVEFAVTKPIPSYLVAFGVGPFEIVDAGKTKHGTPIRILTLAHRAADAAWAAKTTAKLLETTEEFFGIPYPYDKLDMLTIPVTAGFSAMENAGLITFTETMILLDPVRSSKMRQHTWLVVGAHEIAHQWFGNLVTMAWWDDIWLNEGFANWLEHKTVAKIDPASHDELADIGTRNSALDDDSLVSARRIREPITSPDDILNGFDGITYDKGASILNMFEAYLGSDVFARGVRVYLNERAWGNATSSDFAAAISKVAGKDIGPAFATFLDQAGAPEITATVTCEGAPSIALRQQRYVPPGSPSPPATRPWIVPVCVAYEKAGKRAEACTLLDQPAATLALDTKTCPRWVMPNVNGRGYYRSAYTAAQLATLRDEAWPVLSWTERRAILFDTDAGATTGRLPLTVALSLVPKLLAGNDRFTVVPAIALPVGLAELVTDDLRPKYESWLRQTFGPGALEAGLVPKDTDSLDLEDTRGALVGAVGWMAREQKLIGEAVKLSDKWRDLPQSIRGLVLGIAVDAKQEAFDRILRDVATEPDRARRGDMFGALASVRDLRRQTAMLALVTDPKIDIRESLELLFKGPNEATRANARQFFKDHKDAILTRLPADETTGGSLAGLSALFTGTCRADQRAAVVDYVMKTFSTLPGGMRVVKQNIEEMDQCIATRALLEPEVRAWLGGVKIPKPGPGPAAAANKDLKRDSKKIDGAERPPPAKKPKKKSR